LRAWILRTWFPEIVSYLRMMAAFQYPGANDLLEMYGMEEPYQDDEEGWPLYGGFPTERES
jgi:hypothetical protein